jgi:hypothetical protein
MRNLYSDFEDFQPKIGLPQNKIKTTFWYYLQNNGDGTGTPIFCDSKELAELMESLEDEGWGDSCVNSIDMWATSPVHLEDVLTFDEAIDEEYANALNCIDDIQYEDDYYFDTAPYFRWFLTSLDKLRQLEELQSSALASGRVL